MLFVPENLLVTNVTGFVGLLIVFYLVNWWLKKDDMRIALSAHLTKQSIVVDPKEGVRTSVRSADEWLDKDINSVYEIFLRGLSISRHERLFGTRCSYNVPYSWQTYDEIHQAILAVGSALNHIIGFDSGTDNLVGVIGKNSPEWIITEFACAAYSYVLVPLYNTLGDEACEHILKQLDLSILFCDTVKTLQRLQRFGCHTLRYAVVFEEDATLTELKAVRSSPLTVFSFKDVVVIGKANMIPTRLPDPKSLFLLCYTSGTTGSPKGASVTHEAFTRTAQLQMMMVPSELTVRKSDTHLSYLPLAHLMEQLVMAALMLSGASSAFLTTDIKGLTTDLQYVRPSMICLVPRLCSRIYDEVMKKLSHYPLMRKIFEHVVRWRIEEQRSGLYRRNTLWDWLFFRNIRIKCGGNVKFLVYGSAPLSTEIKQFIQAVFACPVSECYGSTETTGIICTTLPGDMNAGYVGALLPGVDVKLADVPDMNLVVARDNQGEIFIRSSICSKGYYKDPTNTAELYDGEWLKSGDVGTWTEVGALKIVDRCKNMFKLSQGEYVAPLKIELVYQHCELINQLYVDGSSLESYLVAIVIPNITNLKRALLAQSQSSMTTKDLRGAKDYEKMTVEELCEEPAARELVLKEMDDCGRKRELSGLERVKAIHLCPEPFTIDNQMLTPTMKISRPRVRRQFADVIKQIYASHVT